MKKNLWKKGMIYGIVVLFIVACIIPASSGNTQNLLGAKINSSIHHSVSNGAYERRAEIIYVDTSAIDARADLTAAQKTALKNRILQHIQNNYDNAVGAGKFTVTNDPAQAGSAARTVKIQPGKDPSGKGNWGDWPYNSSTVNVYLGEFMDDGAVNGSFKNANGTWNATKLGNAIGHTAGHEVGHSYSIGHNHKTGPKEKAVDNRSKMTIGKNINASDRAKGEFLFDNHSKDVLKNNSGKPPCVSAPDYDEKVLNTHFWGESLLPGKEEEGGTFDATFLCTVQYPGWYELGFLGRDTDHGVVDGNASFDFVYKTSLTMNPNLDAEIISFLADQQNHTSWLLRGTSESPYPGHWFPLAHDVLLQDYITNPAGQQVAREVTMMWPDQGVSILFDALSFGEYSNPYNGFTYDYIPTPPRISGPSSGEPGLVYTFTVMSTIAQRADLLYYIDWGDQTITGWFGPFPSGQEITEPHVWSEQGVYTIRVKAKAATGEESFWSTYKVNISTPVPPITIVIKGGIGVSAKIKNTGTENLSNVQWSIHLEGGIVLIGKEKNGTIDLTAGEEKTVSSFVLGFGPSTITATASSINQTANGFVFLIFVIRI